MGWGWEGREDLDGDEGWGSGKGESWYGLQERERSGFR